MTLNRLALIVIGHETGREINIRDEGGGKVAATLISSTGLDMFIEATHELTRAIDNPRLFAPARALAGRANGALF